MIMGYPAYGRGAFERNGLNSTVPLIGAFLSVCVFEGVAGALLWKRRKSGAVLSLALLPAGSVFWWGFDLPIPPLLALARTVLLWYGWRELK